jgi:hypothetical protein
MNSTLFGIKNFFDTQSENFVILLRFLARYIPEQTCLFTVPKTYSSMFSCQEALTLCKIR